MHILGIDVGGTGIKGAVVDTTTGQLTTERHRITTPRPATPHAVAETVHSIVNHFRWQGPIGCGIPGVVRHGWVEVAANLSPEWSGTQIEELLASATGCPVVAANDADVAGLAEMRFGAGHNQPGTVLVITLGTGIGSALFVDGRLVPNTEFGHLEIDGKDAERLAAASVRENRDMSWKKWGKRVDRYLRHVHGLLWPELFIIGGGASGKHEKFFPFLTVPSPVVPAALKNEAGIIGAAILAAEQRQSCGTETCVHGNA